MSHGNLLLASLAAFVSSVGLTGFGQQPPGVGVEAPIREASVMIGVFDAADNGDADFAYLQWHVNF